MPSFAKFPDFERVQWFNVILDQVRPRLIVWDIQQ